MNKTFIISILFIAVFEIAHSQPTLTASGINPVIGDKFVVNTATGNINSGSSGANQTWNLSIASTSQTSYTLVSPSSTPHAADFTNSTVAFSDTANNYSYYNTPSTSYQYFGNASSSGFQSYSNPEDLMRFPFTYSNTFSDNFSCTYISGSTTWYHSGTVTATADGYGTLTTPGGTFSNVLRVLYVENAKDSSATSLSTTKDNFFLWWLNGTHYPVAETYTITVTIGSTFYSYSGGYYLSSVSAVEENEEEINFSVFPNPTNGIFSIQSSDPSTPLRVTAVEIVNVLGEKVYESAVPLINQFTINLSTQPKGIYFVKVQSESRVYTEKVVIQ